MNKTFAFALTVVSALSLGACCSNNANVPANSCPPCDKAPAASACALPASASGAASGDAVVARYSGKTITMAELDKMIAKDIFQMRQQALEAKILTELVEAEAQKAGKSAEDFLRGMAENAAVELPPDSDDHLKGLYAQLQPQLGGKSFEEVKPMLEGILKQDLQKKVVMDYIEGLKKTSGMEILLQEPRVDVKAFGPSRGPENAPVTIVEFSDFECPFCARAAATIEQLYKANEGNVRLVFRAYPLPFHPHAQKASEAALCANEQGKFWELHDAMFGAQDKLEVSDLKEKAKTMGMDAAAFDACLDSGKYADEIKANLKDGAEAGVDGTPAFIINGRLISGARSYDDFQKIIREEIASKK